MIRPPTDSPARARPPSGTDRWPRPAHVVAPEAAGVRNAAVGGSAPQVLMALDPALVPRASAHYTDFGRQLANGIDPLVAHTALPSCAEVRQAVHRAAQQLTGPQARQLLVLGGGHHCASTLAMLQGAIDVCAQRGLPLYVEMTPDTLHNLGQLLDVLRQWPGLHEALGGHRLGSREGQRIAWDFIRATGDRKGIQRFLPELLALAESQERGVPMHSVDSIGPEGDNDIPREIDMGGTLAARVQRQGAGVFVGGLSHVLPITALLRGVGIDAPGLVLFDQSADDMRRHFDYSDEPGLNTLIDMLTYSCIVRAPHFQAVGQRLPVYLVADGLHPFD